MQAERQARPLALALRLRRSSVGGCRHTVVNRPGRPPERCSKLGVCGVGVGAGHACRSRDSLRLLTPSDGRGKRHPSTCTEDEDDAPASSRVEDDEAPPSPSVASSDGGLNQFAKMRLIERARRATSGRSSSGARQHGAPRNSLNSRTCPLLPSPEIPSEAAKTTARQGVPRGSVLVGRGRPWAWPVPSRRWLERALDHPSCPAPAVRTRSLLLRTSTERRP